MSTHQQPPTKVTPGEAQHAFELIELADISRHRFIKRLRRELDAHGPTSYDALVVAATIVRQTHVAQDRPAQTWATETAQGASVPPYIQFKAHKQLVPQSDPSYVDYYRKLVELWPNADHPDLDETARRLASGKEPFGLGFAP